MFVLPSIDRSEVFGIARLEAMACGQPVVSSDTPMDVRVVNRLGMTGLLMPLGDFDVLASALNRLLGDHELLSSLGGAAREQVEREFTAEWMVARSGYISRYTMSLLHERITTPWSLREFLRAR